MCSRRTCARFLKSEFPLRRRWRHEASPAFDFCGGRAALPALWMGRGGIVQAAFRNGRRLSALFLAADGPAGNEGALRRTSEPFVAGGSELSAAPAFRVASRDVDVFGAEHVGP